MDKAALEKRLRELNQQIEQSAARHNALVGHRDEVQFLLQETFKKEVEESEKKEDKAVEAEVVEEKA